MIEHLQAISSWCIRRWALALLLAAMLLTLSFEGPPPAKLETQLDRQLADEQFDFLGWEIKAVWGKLTHSLIAPQRYMQEPARRDFFLDYLAKVAEAQRLDWEIHQIYTDPEVDDPEAASSELREQLDELRTTMEDRQWLAEAIMEEQVACVLVDEGFGLLGQEVPPVSAHFTPLPSMLVISPRERIERIHQLSLVHGLDVARQEAIEGRVDTTQDVSSLVTAIGGLSAYPSMLLENWSINWVIEVTAHEWTHHYLLPRPLGWNYDNSPQARTINETVASIMGAEIGRRVIARYYPEHLPPEPEPEDSSDNPDNDSENNPEEEPAEETEEPAPPEFDFRAEMRETRIRVDELLAEGKIEQAEEYMEQRREMFVEEGYYIRKLNQAYFAFHGAYADQPGAAGKDPIGPAVRKLFERSPDLHTFVERVSGVTTLEELEVLLAQSASNASEPATPSQSPHR